ncbi:MAG: 2-dehydro-3-deoxygalactonokinase [Ginsengibacter sp.]
MQKLISCDWGTSALRLRIIDIDKIAVLGEVTNTQGISSTFDLWQKSGKNGDERISFYQSILSEQIKKLEAQLQFSLDDAPLIISGMASSNMGIMELPYKEAPFSLDGHDLIIKKIEGNNNFGHTTIIISGVRTGSDVMRGEETQLIGSINKDDKEDQVFIFPGTHSKHISIKNGKVTDLETYMTGEFFDLLSKKSVLLNTIEEVANLLNAPNLESFEKGVKDSCHSNLLHNSFLVRTNYLLGKLSKQENYAYLSGILIGTELNELPTVKIPLTIVGDAALNKYYATAAKILGAQKVNSKDAARAVINGHHKIYSTFPAL